MRCFVFTEGQLAIQDGGHELEQITFGMFLHWFCLKYDTSKIDVLYRLLHLMSKVEMNCRKTRQERIACKIASTR